MDIKEHFKSIIGEETWERLKLAYGTKPAEIENIADPNEGKAKFENGTMIQWDGELTEGAQLFVITDSGKSTAPEGEHTLDNGVKVTTDKDGRVTLITQAEANPDAVVGETDPKGTPEQMSDEAKALLETIQNDFNAFKEQIAADKKASDEKFASLESELENEKKTGKELFGIVEKILAIPAEEPAAPVSQKNGFSKVDKDEKIKSLAQTLNKIKINQS